MSERRTVIVGAEHDDRLRERVGEVLRSLGAKKRNHTWGVGGSQEIETLEVEIGGELVVVEAETYMGLSISGPVEVVQAIEALLPRPD